MTKQQSSIKQLEAWHATRPGWAVFGLIELILAYVAASRAIDTGSWWEYLAAFVLLVGAGRNLVHLIKGK